MRRTSKKKLTTIPGPIGRLQAAGGYATIFQKTTKAVKEKFPRENDDHAFGHYYATRTSSINTLFQFYVDLFEHLDISIGTVRTLRQAHWTLRLHQANRTKKAFERNVVFALKIIKNADEQFKPKVSLLSRIECIRLHEAMQCLSSQCHLSAVVMAVSAVEHRLHKIVEKTDSVLYAANFADATLGGIIQLFQRDHYKDAKFQPFKQILPDKHKPLMEMLNIYRIFTAHPKDENVTHQTAAAILSLSFLLLTDKSLKI